MMNQWNAFVEDDFDAKGNYNFDPLCQQKRSEGGRREGGRKVGKRQEYRE